MIVEYATVTRKDGTESRFGREKGRKQFALLTPAGVPDRQARSHGIFD